MSVLARLRFAAARGEDAPAMRALARSAYEHYVVRIGKPPAPMTADYDALAASANVTLAWHGDELVGMLVLELRGTEAWIENVAVAQAMQGSGLGSELLRRAEADAREAGCVVARLFTNERMTENLEFYPRRGYVETERRRDGGFNRVFFTKKLTGAGRADCATETPVSPGEFDKRG
jgi:GNAT superfamily N-acetyltransferase